jgi:hypothetical protein
MFDMSGFLAEEGGILKLCKLVEALSRRRKERRHRTVLKGLFSLRMLGSLTNLVSFFGGEFAEATLKG